MHGGNGAGELARTGGDRRVGGLEALVVEASLPMVMVMMMTSCAAVVVLVVELHGADALVVLSAVVKEEETGVRRDGCSSGCCCSCFFFVRRRRERRDADVGRGGGERHVGEQGKLEVAEVGVERAHGLAGLAADGEGLDADVFERGCVEVELHEQILGPSLRLRCHERRNEREQDEGPRLDGVHGSDAVAVGIEERRRPRELDVLGHARRVRRSERRFQLLRRRCCRRRRGPPMCCRLFRCRRCGRSDELDLLARTTSPSAALQ
mmetsp:Transcript_158/g.452  ORF Transcript_158/g.452 Transcript_158/m.452 type:complete len:265 (-) Transcript_158:109-903(-)